MSSLPPIKRMKIDSQEKTEETTKKEVIGAIKPEKENRKPTGNHKKPEKSPAKSSEKSVEKVPEKTPETTNSSKSFRNKIKASTIDLSTIYGKPFPTEINKFWKSCKKSSPITPLRAQKGWTLVGPFHVLSSKVQFKTNLEACMYHRCYHDTPEIQTFAVSRDSTSRLAFYHLAPNDENPHIIKITYNVSESIILPKFEVLTTAVNISETIFCPKYKPELKKITTTDEFEIVCPNFTGIGISVPMKDDVGYRDLNMTNKKFMGILKKIDKASDDKVRRDAFAPLLQMITYIQYANDECDFGQGYEFGVDLMVYGSKYLTKQALKVLPMAYKLLGRKLFQEISEAHLKDRKNEAVLSEFFK